ncbi:MAG: CopG family ribbon-helix-helix protein [Candidatus Azotimanducaceae bacterium WSBS_2022_MAG_OTU7]
MATLIYWVMNMATTPFSVRIDDDLRAQLKQEAKQLNRSESFVAATAIKKYLESCSQKREAIDLAVAQAEEGNFISSEKMNAWVDSWGSKEEEPLPITDIQK